MQQATQENSTVMVLDDEVNMGRVLQKLLLLDGYTVRVHSSPTAALDELRREAPDVLLSDLRMPGLSGEELLETLRAERIETEVILMTAYGTVESAMRCVHNGAFDYVTKPFDTKTLLATIRKASAKAATRRGVTMGGAREMLGEAPALRAVRDLIRRVAPTEAAVLVTGESGTGKEVAARLLHACSARSRGPFMALSCASIPEALLESELFGHERGAFTGAVDEKTGIVEAANGGTLFLDEIGEMPLGLQAKLLRVLQEREITRVGSTQTRTVDIRVVAATNRDLAAEVRHGRFREDLYYRLNVLSVHLPPLRDRLDDVAILAPHFLQDAVARHRRDPMEFTPEGIEQLKQHRWPGNVRELQNFVQRVAVLCDGGEIGPRQLARLELLASPSPTPNTRVNSGELGEFREERDRFEVEYLRRVLEACGGNVSEAARRSGMSRRHFYEKMEKLGIAGDDFKQ
ncbi:response regulator [bacterium]|nr:response regulator [bacterium]